MSDNQNDFMHSQQGQANQLSQQNQQNLSDKTDKSDKPDQDAPRQSAQSLRAEKLERMNKWHEKYKSQLAPSPLEDITKLCAQLELTHAHPSGIAQLFASERPLFKRFSAIRECCARQVEG